MNKLSELNSTEITYLSCNQEIWMNVKMFLNYWLALCAKCTEFSATEWVTHLYGKKQKQANKKLKIIGHQHHEWKHICIIWILKPLLSSVTKSLLLVTSKTEENTVYSDQKNPPKCWLFYDQCAFRRVVNRSGFIYYTTACLFWGFLKEIINVYEHYCFSSDKWRHLKMWTNNSTTEIQHQIKASWDRMENTN